LRGVDLNEYNLRDIEYNDETVWTKSALNDYSCGDND